MFRLQKLLPNKEKQVLANLRDWMQEHSSLCIAYSGGVDSTLVAAIAYECKGDSALAVTGVSPALAPHLLQEARYQAGWLGIRHQELITSELEDPNYSNNPIDRCFACKKELHRHLKLIATANSAMQVVDGVNLDDLNDYRPGIKAAHQAGSRSPLAELRIDKMTVRRISQALGFPWWDKPAQPCLSSRFPYGQVITAERLYQVGRAEAWLTARGLTSVRVRSNGLEARIEVPSQQIDVVLALSQTDGLVKFFRSIGFISVSLDLEGLVSGKLNRHQQSTVRTGAALQPPSQQQ
ncbi:ATP-dependent sacrificial sulfur transferase LarE [Synechococcus sp. M16CYN]|uniref:ATP-dependent sacrificial sulfur transferase LarE n=1 Tax=Synechococcus sp. M16CYN TaxID=3103139 RepID=UPI003340FBAD